MAIDSDDVNQHFGRIWPVHVEFFTRLLIELRRDFKGDLDLMLVLATIGLRSLPAYRVDGLSYADFKSGATVGAPKPINVQSIADSSGIPRETVRRKVLQLLENGWAERDESGHLIVSAKARDDLSPSTEATFRYLVAVGSVFADLAAKDAD
jgi:hypothetical protein